MFPINTQLPVHEFGDPDVDFTSNNNPPDFTTFGVGNALNGKLTGAGLVTPNATYSNAALIRLSGAPIPQIPGYWGGNARLIKIPGRTTVRTGDGPAFDAANDLNWRDYAIVSGMGNFCLGVELGKSTVLCTFGVHKTYTIRLTSTLGAGNPGNRRFFFEVKKFGRFNFPYAAPQYITVDTGSTDFSSASSLLSNLAPSTPEYFAVLMDANSDGTEFLIGLCPGENFEEIEGMVSGYPLAVAKFNVTHDSGSDTVSISYSMYANYRQGSLYTSTSTGSIIADTTPEGIPYTFATAPKDTFFLYRKSTSGPPGSGQTDIQYGTGNSLPTGFNILASYSYPIEGLTYQAGGNAYGKTERKCWFFYDENDNIIDVTCIYEQENGTFHRTTSINKSLSGSYQEIRAAGVQESLSGDSGGGNGRTYEVIQGTGISFECKVNNQSLGKFYFKRKPSNATFSFEETLEIQGSPPSATVVRVGTNDNTHVPTYEMDTNIPGATALNLPYEPGYRVSGGPANLMNSFQVNQEDGSIIEYMPFLHLFNNRTPGFMLGIDGDSVFITQYLNGGFPVVFPEVGYLGNHVEGKYYDYMSESVEAMDTRSDYVYISIHPVTGETDGLQLTPYCYI